MALQAPTQYHGDPYASGTDETVSSGGSLDEAVGGTNPYAGYKPSGGYSGLDGSMLFANDRGGVVSLGQMKTALERKLREGLISPETMAKELKEMGLDASIGSGTIDVKGWAGTIAGKAYSVSGDGLRDKTSAGSLSNQINVNKGLPVTIKGPDGKPVTVKPGASGYPASPSGGSSTASGASSGGSASRPTGGSGTAAIPPGKTSGGAAWGGGGGNQNPISLEGVTSSGGGSPGIDVNAPLGVDPRDPSYQKDPGGFSSPASFKSMGLGPESTFNDLVAAVLGIQEGRQQAAQSDLSQAYQKEQNDPLAQGVNAAAQNLLANPYSISDGVFAQMVGKNTTALNQRFNLTEQQIRDRAAAQGMGNQGTTFGAIDANRVANINAVSGGERDLAIERERLRKQEEQQALSAAGSVRGQEAAIRGDFTKMGQENLRGDTVGDALLLGQVVGNQSNAAKVKTADFLYPGLAGVGIGGSVPRI